jgi:seryl-tRNA synthetase
MEEKIKKEQLEAKEAESKGIDIDLIKTWITSNTDAMLKHQELKEYLEKQNQQKDKLENEMLEEGDKMTDLLIAKEKLEFEKEELEAAGKDEGRVLEIDESLKDIGLEIQSITDTLDYLEEALELVQDKVYQITEEIEGFDLESVTPLSFNALDNVESAKITLKTFFQIVLELNIYKRDLEQKCIEQDETVI